MGWLRTLLLGDIGNRLDISDNEVRISRMRRSIRQKSQLDTSQNNRIHALEQCCEQLELTVGSLMKLLAANQVVPQAQLATLVMELEPED